MPGIGVNPGVGRCDPPDFGIVGSQGVAGGSWTGLGKYNSL